LNGGEGYEPARWKEEPFEPLKPEKKGGVNTAEKKKGKTLPESFGTLNNTRIGMRTIDETKGKEGLFPSLLRWRKG